MQALIARKERESGSEHSKATPERVYDNAAYVPDVQGKHSAFLSCPNVINVQTSEGEVTLMPRLTSDYVITCKSLRVFL